MRHSAKARRPWLADEDEIVRETFATGPHWLRSAIERLPGRTPAAIMQRASNLRLKRADRPAIEQAREIVAVAKQRVEPAPRVIGTGANVPDFLRDQFRSWGVG